MKGIRILKTVYKLLHETFIEFKEDNAIKFSAALAYYTIFSIPPALLIIISLCGIFFGKDAIEGEVFKQLNDLIGNDAALKVQEGIRNIHFSKETNIATVAGSVILILGATGIFGEVQDSINTIWGIKAKPKRGLLKLVLNRLISFSMLISIGFVLSVALLINALVALLSKGLTHYFPELTIYFFLAFDNAITFAAITALFAMIFKLLPDAKIEFRDVIVGAIATALLFMIGKIVIGYYLGHSTVASVYGTAGSVIVVMVWVYYNAIILYFGAEFTEVYTRFRGRNIRPNVYAVLIEKKIIELKKPGN